VKKRKPLPAERKDGTFETKLSGKTYEVRTSTKMGSDGIPEDHMNFIGARGTIFTVARDLKCRNVMTNADRKRLGLPEDK
jgi:hypothetical protein